MSVYVLVLMIVDIVENTRILTTLPQFSLIRVLGLDILNGYRKY